MTENVPPPADKGEDTFKKIRDRIMAKPHGAIGYMTAIRNKREFRAGDIKALFNHAGSPVPPELAARGDEEKCRLGLLKKASLVFRALRKAGDNVVRSAGLWLRSF